MEEQIQLNKSRFQDFLKTKVDRESTIKQYISWMDKIQKWFVQNSVVDNRYNIWTNIDKIVVIDNQLKTSLIEEWKSANKPLKNWMSSPWNAWVAFNSNREITIEEQEEHNFAIENTSETGDGELEN